MHSDAVAARYGFSGALVSGVNVFGYMSQPLVAESGPQWFERRAFDVRFLLPAYEHDTVTVSSAPLADGRLETRAENQHGAHLATLLSGPATDLCSARAQTLRTEAAAFGAVYDEASRPLISWEAIVLQRPAPTWRWRPSRADNAAHVSAQRDRSPCYADADGAPIHPYLLLDTCNRALMRQFVLPAWIHVGTAGTLWRPIRVGETVCVDCQPIDKWERKGHQFVRLYLCMFCDDELVFEAEHTAIFRIAEK